VGFLLGPVPFGKIELPAASIHIALDQPGDRREVRIPRPAGFVAVAILTGANRQLSCLLATPDRLLEHRWIGVIASVRYQLNDGEEAERAEE
jgi:hypothetical protein